MVMGMQKGDKSDFSRSPREARRWAEVLGGNRRTRGVRVGEGEDDKAKEERENHLGG